MEIRKTDIQNLDTKAKIEAAVQIHRSEEKERLEEGINKAYTQNIKIRDLSIHLLNGGEWKFIDKTLEKETEDAKAELIEKAAQDKQNRVILAKTDPLARDLLITELMNESGFTPAKIALSQITELKDSKDMSQFWAARELKLADIRTMIADA